MSLEALPTSNDFPNFLIYDTISASPTNFFFPNNNINNINNNNNNNSVLSFSGEFVSTQTSPDIKPGQQRRKRRRKPKSSKNKEEAETQRMTHIAVERNRRRQMNEHLSVLRSLMPDCYIQRVYLHILFNLYIYISLDFSFIFFFCLIFDTGRPSINCWRSNRFCERT